MIPKILLVVDKIDVESYAEFGCGFSFGNGPLTMVPAFIQGDIASVGILTPKRSNLNPLRATLSSGGVTPSGGGT